MPAQAIGLGHDHNNQEEAPTGRPDSLFIIVDGMFHVRRIESRSVGALNSDGFRDPDRWPGLTWGRPVGTEPHGLVPMELNGEPQSSSPQAKVWNQNQFELTGGATKLIAKTLQPEQFRVVKMKFPRRKDPDTGKSVSDKSTVIYNEFITVTGIPLEAYDDVVNGKPAIEWVMESQAVTTDKDSGIVHDANLWATETMHNPRYPLELL